MIAGLNSVEPVLFNVSEVEYFMDDEQARNARRPVVVRLAKERLGMLEEARAGRDWCVGDTFTVADLMLASILKNAGLLGSRGQRTMPEVEEWMFPRGGGLQVYQGAERAGHCSFTLAVSDIDAVARKLAALGVQPGARTSSERIKTLMVKDPDGNSIAIAQALDPALAR